MDLKFKIWKNWAQFLYFDAPRTPMQGQIFFVHSKLVKTYLVLTILAYIIILQDYIYVTTRPHVLGHFST